MEVILLILGFFGGITTVIALEILGLQALLAPFVGSIETVLQFFRLGG